MELWFAAAFLFGILVGVLVSQVAGVFAFRKGQRDIARKNGTIYLDSQTDEMYLELEHEFDPNQNVAVLAITRK